MVEGVVEGLGGLGPGAGGVRVVWVAATMAAGMSHVGQGSRVPRL